MVNGNPRASEAVLYKLLIYIYFLISGKFGGVNLVRFAGQVLPNREVLSG
jgi:hypothetical protein